MGRHPNIVCLLGVVLKDEPQCLIFEYMPQGDLHEYLLMHSPKSQEMPLSLSTSGEEGEGSRVLDHGDMAYIAIQVAAGMEYLSSHHYVHRGETCPFLDKSPPQRAAPLPHATESHGDSCSVSNRPRNSPVWSGRPRGPASGRELPIPSPHSVWGSWGSLSRWWRWRRPTIPWRQPRWVSLWHSKHSKPPDGLDQHYMECDL